MKVSFVAGVSPVVASPRESMAFYGEALGVPFDDPEAGYPMTDALAGVEHFSLWGLRDCAQACFGTDTWPEDRIVPQANIEFDAERPEAVTQAAEELTAKGYALLVAPKTEPWGQTVTRLQTPEGLLMRSRTRRGCTVAIQNDALRSLTAAPGPEGTGRRGHTTMAMRRTPLSAS